LEDYPYPFMEVSVRKVPERSRGVKVGLERSQEEKKFFLKTPPSRKGKREERGPEGGWD